MSTDSMVVLRDKVRAWRSRHHFTQAEIGERIGLGRERYSTWENATADNMPQLRREPIARLREIEKEIDAEVAAGASITGNGSDQVEAMLRLAADKLQVLADFIRSGQGTLAFRVEEYASSIEAAHNRLNEFRAAANNITKV